MMARTKNFMLRWQEKLILLPLLLILGMIGYLVFTARDQTATQDLLAQWALLPLKSAYAAAWCGFVYHFRRRWRFKMDKDQQQAWWVGVRNGERGALTILVTDAAVTISCAWFLRYFFS